MQGRVGKCRCGTEMIESRHSFGQKVKYCPKCGMGGRV